MVFTRNSAKQTKNHHNSSFPSSSHIIKDLLSSFHSSQELKLPELKSLYYLLVHFSLDPAICCNNSEPNLTVPELKIGLHGISVPFSEICSLSDILFKILSEIFKEFLFTSQNLTANFSEKDSLHVEICASAQRLNLLLRCCMVMLKLLVHDQDHLVENGLVLHAILAKLCSLNVYLGNEQNTIRFEKVSQEYKWDDTHFSSFTEEFVASLQFIEPIDHCRHFFCTMLEVFVDELSSNGLLREYFQLVDSCFVINKLFIPHPGQGDIGSVIELVCTHFCMSFWDEQTFESIEDKLFGFLRGNSRVPELGPLSALILLLNPLMFTAPNYLQAHLICLVSESIASDTGMQSDKSIDFYLAAFERSVILYIKHMSPSDRDSLGKFSAYKGNSRPSFDSYLRPNTRRQLNHLINKLDDSLQLQLEHICPRSKSDLLVSCIAHVSDSKAFFNTSFKDEIVSISSKIIVKAFPDEVVGNELCTGYDTKPGNIYLLASIMKLMTCSLLQATRSLMYTCDLNSSRTLKDLSTCKEHDLLAEIINRFKKCNISLPIQKSLITAMDKYPERHKQSKLMLIHFSSLLSLSFKNGVSFVSKCCISVMIAVMNLFYFEEGNMDALRLSDGMELSLSSLRKENVQKAVVNRRSSLVIASKFKKARTLYLRPLVASSSTGTENDNEDSPYVVGMEEETEEACDGSLYLKCVIKNCEKALDFDDLADFVVCKKDKDYSSWLKDCEMYRKKKCEKLAVIKLKQKKRFWKYLRADRG